MDLTTSPELERLRQDLRRLIAAEAPRMHVRSGVRVVESREELEQMKRWTRRLYELQFAGRDWPVEYGGLGDHDVMTQVMIVSEFERAGVPGPLGFYELPAHALFKYGTPEQCRAFLPPMRAAETVWCQLFSEPGAGSDLASLRTRAVADGDRYLVNGQKVWNTQAQWADFGFMLARTSTEGARHAGLSMFLIDMRQPGVDVRPLREITGTWDFNEVFLTDAVVPAFNRIGREGQGWEVAGSALALERVHAATNGIKARVALDKLLERARTMGPLPDGMRTKLVELHAACEISTMVGNVIATRDANGKSRPADPAIAKMFFSDVNLGIATLAMELLGEQALHEEGDPLAVDGGRWPDMFLYARVWNVAGGSSEIMRNILAERVLGMPRK